MGWSGLERAGTGWNGLERARTGNTGRTLPFDSWINGPREHETGGEDRNEDPTDLDARRSAQRLAPEECHHKQQLHGDAGAPHATPQQRVLPTRRLPTRRHRHVATDTSSTDTSSPSHATRAHQRLELCGCPVLSLRCARRRRCCWAAGARRGLPRNTDEARGRAERSRL